MPFCTGCARNCSMKVPFTIIFLRFFFWLKSYLSALKRTCNGIVNLTFQLLVKKMNNRAVQLWMYKQDSFSSIPLLIVLLSESWICKFSKKENESIQKIWWFRWCECKKYFHSPAKWWFGIVLVHLLIFIGGFNSMLGTICWSLFLTKWNLTQCSLV